MKVPEASCYPPALSSRIKGSPLREARKRGKATRVQARHESRPSSLLQRRPGAAAPGPRRRGGSKDPRAAGLGALPTGRLGCPSSSPGLRPGGPGLGPAFPDAATKSYPPAPAGACAAHGDLCRADRSDTPSRDGKGRFSSSKAKVRAKEGLPPYEGSSSKCSETENDLRVAGARAA